VGVQPSDTPGIVYRPFALDSQQYQIVMVYDAKTKNPALHNLLHLKQND